MRITNSRSSYRQAALPAPKRALPLIVRVAKKRIAGIKKQKSIRGKGKAELAMNQQKKEKKHLYKAKKQKSKPKYTQAIAQSAKAIQKKTKIRRKVTKRTKGSLLKIYLSRLKKKTYKILLDREIRKIAKTKIRLVHDKK